MKRTRGKRSNLIKKTLASLLAVVFLSTSTLSLAEGQADKDKLAPLLRSTIEGFRMKFLAGEILLSHKRNNEYIEKKIKEVGYEKLSRTLVTIEGVESDTELIAIPGLLKFTGLPAHVGLGRHYGKPVIYVDSGLYYNEDIRQHEFDEVSKWEALRKALGLEPGEMRRWIRDNIETAVNDERLPVEYRGKNSRQIAERIHKKSHPVGHLDAQFANTIDYEYLAALTAYGGEEEEYKKDITIAAIKSTGVDPRKEGTPAPLFKSPTHKEPHILKKRAIHFLVQYNIMFSAIVGAIGGSGLYLLAMYMHSTAAIATGALGIPLSGIISWLWIDALNLRYPLKHLEELSPVLHPERDVNVAELRRILELYGQKTGDGVAFAYDQMVSDVATFFDGGRLQEDFSYTIFIAAFSDIMGFALLPLSGVERYSTFQIRIDQEKGLLTVDKRDGKSEQYHLVPSDSLKPGYDIVVEDESGKRRIPLRPFVEEKIGVRLDIGNMGLNELFEIDRICIDTSLRGGEGYAVYRDGTIAKLFFLGNGQIACSSIGAAMRGHTAFATSVRTFKRYGTPLFAYHVHPRLLGDSMGNALTPSPADIDSVIKRSAELNQSLPHIIWAKDDNHRLIAKIIAPRQYKRPTRIAFLDKYFKTINRLSGLGSGVAAYVVIPNFDNLWVIAACVGGIGACIARIAILSAMVKYPLISDNMRETTMTVTLPKPTLPVLSIPGPPENETTQPSKPVDVLVPEDGIREDKPKGSPASCLETIKQTPNLIAKALNKEVGIKVSEVTRLRLYHQSTVYKEFKILKDIGVLAPVEGKRGRYRFADMMIGSDGNYTKTLINAIADIRYQVGKRGEERPLHRWTIPDDETDLVKELVKMTILHQINLMQKPAIPEGKVLWHMLEQDVVSIAQQSSFAQNVNSAAERSKAPERIYILKKDESIEDAIGRIKADHPDAIFDIALSDESHIEKVPGNIKRLVFKGNPGDVAQLEGFVAALRALHGPKEDIVPTLKRIYSVLTGAACLYEIPPDMLDDPVKFAHSFIFDLPPATPISAEEISKMNGRLRQLLMAA